MDATQPVATTAPLDAGRPTAGGKSIWSIVAITAVAVLALVGAAWMWSPGESAGFTPPQPLDPDRAMRNVRKLCEFGPRPSGSEAMQRQQTWIENEFRRIGGRVRWQEFPRRHPQTGATITLKNLIIEFGPNTSQRLMVCAHYDTRPFPDQDRKNPRGRFVGANDGASGVALLLELAVALEQQPPDIGVDLVLFDGEELIYGPNDEWFLGSTHFARVYIADKESPRYRNAVLVDMIGDRNLEILYEVNSYRAAPELCQTLWRYAAELDIPNFIPRLGYELQDDHLPLINIAGIPSVDLIDFDYPTRGVRATQYWHTTEDTPDKLSGESICKVAAVVLRWIRNEKP